MITLLLLLYSCGFCQCAAPSLTTWCVHSVQLQLALARAVILLPESSRARDLILLTQIWDSPNLRGQDPLFICPRNRVAPLYSRHCVFLWDSKSKLSYDRRLVDQSALVSDRHLESVTNCSSLTLEQLVLDTHTYSPGTDRSENVSSIIACLLVAEEKCS
jgi:hypothetical protein